MQPPLLAPVRVPCAAGQAVAGSAASLVPAAHIPGTCCPHPWYPLPASQVPASRLGQHREGRCPAEPVPQPGLRRWVIVFPADLASWLHRVSAGVADCFPFPGSALGLSEHAARFGIICGHGSQGPGVSGPVLCGCSVLCGGAEPWQGLPHTLSRSSSGGAEQPPRPSSAG